MTPHITHLLRSQRTLLAHELREQGPLGLVLLAAGVAILFSVRVAAGTDPGEIGVQLPYVVPALAALLLAFPAADLLGRDAGSGLARTLAAAPVGRAQWMAPRLAVFTVVAAVVVAALVALEPPRASMGVGHFGPAKRYFVALAPLLVFVALGGMVLQSATAALIAGTVVYCAALPGLELASRWSRHEADLIAGVGVFAEAFTGALSVATLLPGGFAALLIARALRGANTRRWTRRLAGACGAALLFIAPTAVPAALETYATIHVAFDDPEARVAVGKGAGPDRVIVQVVAKNGRWSSWWDIDLETAQRRRFGDWTNVRPEGRPLGSYWLVEPQGRADGRHGRVTVAKLRFDDGAVSEPLRIRRLSLPSYTSPRDQLVYVSDALTLHVVSLVDGTSTQLFDVPELELVGDLRLSPDGRWLALCDSPRVDPEDPRRSLHRVRMLDTRSGALVQSVGGVAFRAWRSGSAPLVVTRTRGGAPLQEGPWHYALGPDGAAPFPLEARATWLEQLEDGRFVCVTEDGRVLLLGADGTTVRTLRAPATG